MSEHPDDCDELELGESDARRIARAEVLRKVAEHLHEHGFTVLAAMVDDVLRDESAR